MPRTFSRISTLGACYDSSNETSNEEEEEVEILEDGKEVMCSVPYDHWCVSRSDLIQIRRQIAQAIKDGLIIPNEKDDFDPDDDTVGPSVYTVNEYFIKPVTHKAGDVSYAIMMNREGIECDVFVTHAWQEGIFEFIDKVLHSWPPCAKCAYCCMLSNPQNLNITDMINNPRESPFAKALDKASYVLVIPNRNGSIYSRLWCVYEIHLATEKKKQIYIATRSIASKYIRAVFNLILTALVAGLIFPLVNHILNRSIEEEEDGEGLGSLTALDWVLLVSVAVAALSSVVLVFSGNTGVQRIVNNIGIAALVGWFLTNPPDLLLNYSKWDIDDPDHLFDLSAAVMGCILVPFFLISEFDRLLEVEFQYEEHELTRHYTGSVLDAKCFSHQDKVNIFGDIGDAHEKVDGAVYTLIESGMSTPALRTAAELGVDVHGAGHLKIASVVVQWLVWLFLMISTFFDIEQDVGDDQSIRRHWKRKPSTETQFLWEFKQWNALARILIVLSYVCVIPFKYQDGQIFVARCIVSWSHIMFLVFIPIYAWLQSTRWGTLFQFLSTLYELCVLGLCIAGLAKVAQIPLVGPCLAQFTLWSFSCCCTCFRKKKRFKNRRARNDDSSDDDSGNVSPSDDDEQFTDIWKKNLLSDVSLKVPPNVALPMSGVPRALNYRGGVQIVSRAFQPMQRLGVPSRRF